ncbi:MAG: hypothetical protein WC169_12505 [Dehalococcoidia bacterium]
MEENKRLKYTSYTAGAIEAASNKEMKSWRAEIREKLNSPDLGIYDPVEQESKKVGRESKNQVEYITGLKQGGHYELFHEEMEKIWWGNIDTKKLDRIRLLIYLYEKARLEGNYISDFKYWGDYEAVVRSDFIITYLPKDTKTVGTLYEVQTCYFFGIPVYLILPDCSKTEANSTLIDTVIKSGGQIFYSINDCVNFIKEKYKLKEVKEEKK